MTPEFGVAAIAEMAKRKRRESARDARSRCGGDGEVCGVRPLVASGLIEKSGTGQINANTAFILKGLKRRYDRMVKPRVFGNYREQNVHQMQMIW